MDRVFPRSEGGVSQLLLSEPLTAAELCRVLDEYLASPGSYRGVDRKVVIELLRLHSYTRRQFEVEFPDLLDTYDEVWHYQR